MKTMLIVNPTSARGHMVKRWPEIEQALRSVDFTYEATLTERRGHATELARAAVESGYELVVAVGGDGTLNEVMNGMVVQGKALNPAAVLGVISSGTGSDFARTAGVPRDAIAAARHIALSTRTSLIDLGEMIFAVDGQERHRYFVNVAGMGFDAEVISRLEQDGKRGGGTLPYLAALVTTIFRYRNQEVRLDIDGTCYGGRMNSVVVCNGKYFGGGMRIGPNATLDDGRFHVITLGDFSTREVLANTSKLYNGSHLSLAKVSEYTGRVIRVEPSASMFIEADGELIGPGPATFQILPAALKLRV